MRKLTLVVVFSLYFLMISLTLRADNTYNVSSNNQGGGITAAVVNMQGSPARHLNEQFKTKLLASLPKEKLPIIINSIANDSEAYTFAEEVRSYLKEEGWTVEHLQAFFSPPVVGQQINPIKDGKITIKIGSRG